MQQADCADSTATNGAAMKIAAPISIPVMTRRGLIGAAGAFSFLAVPVAGAVPSGTRDWTSAVARWEKASSCWEAAMAELDRAEAAYRKEEQILPAGLQFEIGDTEETALARALEKEGRIKDANRAAARRWHVPELEEAEEAASDEEHEAFKAMLRCRAPHLGAVRFKLEQIAERDWSDYLHLVVRDLDLLGAAA